MATTSDRVDELLEGVKRNRRVLVTPEGVPFDLTVAGCGERATAFAIDLALMLAAVIFLSLLGDVVLRLSVARTFILFAAFLIRIFYFTHFELVWQGRTPGKKICGLRVINADGGELTPGAVIARNLIREAEFFLPLSLLFSLDVDRGRWQQLSLVGWALLVASLPLWNKARLRAGDIIAGTQVISMPKRILSRDLTIAPVARAEQVFSFSSEQLKKYGAYELQVLEELLRRPAGKETTRLLQDVCLRICRKIEWPDPVPPDRVRQFLGDFYTAERADLERGKLFGRVREDKNTPEATKKEGPHNTQSKT